MTIEMPNEKYWEQEMGDIMKKQSIVKGKLHKIDGLASKKLIKDTMICLRVVSGLIIAGVITYQFKELFEFIYKFSYLFPYFMTCFAICLVFSILLLPVMYILKRITEIVIKLIKLK